MLIWLLFVLLDMLSMSVSLHVLVIIEAIICWLICPCSLPVSSFVLALLLLLLSSYCTLSLGLLFWGWVMMKHCWKKLSSIVGFGYSWDILTTVDGDSGFIGNPSCVIWLDVNHSWLKPLSPVGWTSIKLSATSLNNLLLLGNSSSYLIFWFFFQCDLSPKNSLLVFMFVLMVNCVHEWLFVLVHRYNLTKICNIAWIYYCCLYITGSVP